MAHQLSDLARSSVDAFNGSDWQAARDLFGPGLVYEETGTGRHITDIDEMVTVLQAWKAAFPDGAGEVLRTVESGDTVVMEIRWTGTQDGPMDLGETVVPPSGRHMDALASVWQRWKDGRVIEQRHHVDMLTMLGQIGAIPAPAQARPQT